MQTAMTSTAQPVTHSKIDEPALQHLAETLAPRLLPGDFLALQGDLGAGKTAFARFLIRTLMQNETEEVPSPTFALVQPYETPRFPVHHYDFYRLAAPDEAVELGLGEALENGIAIAEWPERLEDRLPPDRLEIRLAEADAPHLRQLTLTAHGNWQPRLFRFSAILAFLEAAGWGTARQNFLNGDCSTRSYARLHRDGGTALLMDSPKMPDGPPIRGNRPYSRIAHLAEDVIPFVAMSDALRQAGLAAPEILAQDLEHGFLLIEDFGDLTFSRLAAQGADLWPSYRLAIDVLLQLRRSPPAAKLKAEGILHELPEFDREALAIETELLTDWYLPAATGQETPEATKVNFAALWNAQFDWLLTQPAGWVLRDFHSPNLIWRPEQAGVAQLGLIDFQDAMRGHPAYDLVSLLQDARIDLPPGLETELLAYYCKCAAADPSFDHTAFLRAYRLLGAQRATKLLGLFVRLSRRDGKRAYLQHMPRNARYLTANLADPDLAALKAWYEREVPLNVEEIATRV